jgi:hypothetical protein
MTSFYIHISSAEKNHGVLCFHKKHCIRVIRVTLLRGTRTEIYGG